METYEFEIQTVKKRVFELEAESLDDAIRRLNETIEKEAGDTDEAYWLIWDTIYKGEIIEDEQIIEAKHNNKILIKRGEVSWFTR